MPKKLLFNPLTAYYVSIQTIYYIIKKVRIQPDKIRRLDFFSDFHLSAKTVRESHQWWRAAATCSWCYWHLTAAGPLFRSTGPVSRKKFLRVSRSESVGQLDGSMTDGLMQRRNFFSFSFNSHTRLLYCVDPGKKRNSLKLCIFLNMEVHLI